MLKALQPWGLPALSDGWPATRKDLSPSDGSSGSLSPSWKQAPGPQIAKEKLPAPGKTGVWEAVATLCKPSKQLAGLPAQPPKPEGEATSAPKPSLTVALPTLQSQKVLGFVLTRTHQSSNTTSLPSLKAQLLARLSPAARLCDRPVLPANISNSAKTVYCTLQLLMESCISPRPSLVIGAYSSLPDTNPDRETWALCLQRLDPCPSSRIQTALGRF